MGTLPAATPATSPSVWREWIEMLRKLAVLLILQSPSVWREWIEMLRKLAVLLILQSPSVWREWIEMVALATLLVKNACLPPCGGSGLK